MVSKDFDINKTVEIAPDTYWIGWVEKVAGWHLYGFFPVREKRCHPEWRKLLKKGGIEMELINEHEIGVSKGTEVEQAVMANFKGECTEVGLYLAMARQAQREGFPDVADALKTIAWEEAGHAAQFAEMNGLVSKDTKENLEKMLAGEIGANKGKKEAAKKARECNCDPAHDFFDESSRDEARHARMLKGILNRFFDASH